MTVPTGRELTGMQVPFFPEVELRLAKQAPAGPHGLTSTWSSRLHAPPIGMYFEHRRRFA